MAVNEDKTKKPQESGGADPHSPDTEYTYQTAGLRERSGTIPLWLWVVYIGLIVWGVYYTWTYWTPPAGG